MARKKYRHRPSAKRPSQYRPEPEESPSQPSKPSKEVKEDKESQETGQEAEKAAKPEAPESPESHARLSVLIYVVAGIVVGYISILLAPIAGNMLTIVGGLVLAWVTGRVVQACLGKKEAKWLLGNGLVIYLFVWLIAWIFFYNLIVLAA